MQQRTQHGWFGAGHPALQLPRHDLIASAPRRRVALPSNLQRELATIAGAARTAGQGGSTAGAKLVSDAEAILLRRATMGPTTADYQRIEAIGYDAWLDEQLDHENLDDGGFEDSLLDSLPTLSMSAEQLYTQYDDNPFIPVFELWVATVYRALYSPRQLFERMAIFWSDHFSIDIFGDYQQFLKPVDERDVVRANALGTFPEILSASAHSASMLVYLTNDTNEKNHPNENYARELMELHTMGADRGYSEEDVKEVARCLTGWSWQDPYRASGPEEVGTFKFYSFLHDNGSKKVLGKKIPSGGGQNDGERVLDILINRKETREYVAEKMARWLHGYEPSKKTIRKIAKSYQKSKGDIRSMVRTALKEKQISGATPKLKRPLHLAVSGLRALGADVSNTAPVLDVLADAGHLPFTWTPPNGYPDSSAWWSSAILPRWNVADPIIGGEGVTLDPSVDDPSGSVNQIIDRLDTLMFNGGMLQPTRDALKGFLGNNPTRGRVRQAIGIALSAPEFQEY